MTILEIAILIIVCVAIAVLISKSRGGGPPQDYRSLRERRIARENNCSVEEARRIIESQKTSPAEALLIVNEIEKRRREREGPSTLTCPKCLSPHIAANKKGYGLGKAAVGGILTGGIGLLAGFIGSRKIYLTCLKCGHQWNAGNR